MIQHQLVLHDRIIRAMSRNEGRVHDWCETHQFHSERGPTFYDSEFFVIELSEYCATAVMDLCGSLEQLEVALDKCNDAVHRQPSRWNGAFVGPLFRDLDLEDVIVAVSVEVNR